MNRLTKRVQDITMPEVKIIDLSKEKDIISEELLYGVTGSRKNRNIFKNNKRCT